MSMREAVEKYGTPEAGSSTSSVHSGTATPATAVPPAETIEAEEPRPPAFLPPSADLSGAIVASNSKRIWEAAEFFHAHMYATNRGVPPK